MSLTKKDFESLADELAGVRPPRRKHAQFTGWYNAVQSVMNVCSSANPAFARMRFQDACIERQSYNGG